MWLLLFDIDGTLLLGQGAGGRSMERAGRAVLGPAFSLQGIDFGGALDPWIYRQAAERMGFAEHHTFHDRFRARYLEELTTELATTALVPRRLPGVVALLERLATRPEVTLGLVTGNYRDAAPLKLKAAGLQPERFALGAFGDEGDTRPALVRLALERWGERGARVDPARTVVIGDTPRDVDCAKQNGCRCLAVATGAHPMEALTAAGADRVVADLTDPRVLDDWLV